MVFRAARLDRPADRRARRRGEERSIHPGDEPRRECFMVSPVAQIYGVTVYDTAGGSLECFMVSHVAQVDVRHDYDAAVGV